MRTFTLLFSALTRQIMENNHTIYFNMCHHYRKILNAKPRVDTSLPKARQTKENNDQWKWQSGGLPVLSKIPSYTNPKSQPELRNSQNYYQRHLQCKFESASQPFTKTILKRNNNAQSNLRTSHLRCPLHKKHVQLTVSNKTDSNQAKRNEHQNISKTATSISNTPVKFSKPSSVSSVNSYSGEPSEDSAYNEGECNLSSDSRGSSPQNSINEKKSAAPISKTRGQSTTSNSTRLTRDKMEASVYTQFLKDITNDILKRNLVTNEALRSVFQQHVKLNKYDLQLENMLNEITKLQERLGVPEDVEFDDEDYGLGKINLNEDVTKVVNETESQEKVLPFTASKIEMGEGRRNSSSSAKSTNEDHVQNDYSDNFSEEASCSGSSLSQSGKINESTNRELSVETQNEAASEIEEDVLDLENRSEEYSDVEEDVSHLQSDSEISEVM